MKKLASIIAGLFIASSTPNMSLSQPLPDTLGRDWQYLKGNLIYVLNVTYDPYHFKFECMDGEFEHAEHYDGDGKRELCFESLKLGGIYSAIGRHILYDNDNFGPDCDGKVDEMMSDHWGKKRKHYPGIFLPLDGILKKFKKDYGVEEIRKEWARSLI